MSTLHLEITPPHHDYLTDGFLSSPPVVQVDHLHIKGGGTVRLRTQDSTYKIALTRFPNVWSATVIVATFALAGYRLPQDSSNELPFRRAMERGQPTTVAVMRSGN